MGLCGGFRCGCGVTSTPATQGAIDGELPSIFVSGSGQPGDPYDLELNDAWAAAVATAVAQVDANTSQLSRLPLKVEHGRVTNATSDANGDIAVTFASAFGDTPAVFLTRRGATTTHFSCMLSASSTTGFSARMFSDNARQLNTAGNGFDWLAVGIPA